jgi:hypothetical protein
MTKWMYIVLIIVVIWTAFVSYTNVSIYIEFSDPSDLHTPNLDRLNSLINRNFARVTSILEVIAIIIGILGLKNLKKTSLMIILTSLPMLFWSYLMYQKPTHISVDEVILAWIIYMIGLIVLSAIGFKNYKKTPEMEWDENILDHEI